MKIQDSLEYLLACLGALSELILVYNKYAFPIIALYCIFFNRVIIRPAILIGTAYYTIVFIMNMHDKAIIHKHMTVERNATDRIALLFLIATIAIGWIEAASYIC